MTTTSNRIPFWYPRRVHGHCLLRWLNPIYRLIWKLTPTMYAELFVYEDGLDPGVDPAKTKVLFAAIDGNVRFAEVKYNEITDEVPLQDVKFMTEAEFYAKARKQ